MSNILYTFENQLSGVTGSFQDVDVSNVKEELEKWNLRKETDPDVYPILKTYWDYVKFGDNWTPSGTAWSSAFISYVLRDEEFPKRSAHFQYIQDIINDNYPSWRAFSISKTPRLQLNIGDVLIKPRSASNTSTHGDIVYKIEDGIAYLVGGNVSNTAKVTESIRVDQNNVVTGVVDDYVIILKKKSSMKNVAIIGIVGLIGLGLFLNMSMKK